MPLLSLASGSIDTEFFVAQEEFAERAHADESPGIVASLFLNEATEAWSLSTFSGIIPTPPSPSSP